MSWFRNTSEGGRTGRRTTLVIGVLIGLLAMPVAVWASHQFPDVPNSSPYHSNISAIADAGVAGGYGDGTFKPNDVVIRQHMAAFLHRGLGRISATKTVGDVSPNSAATKIASLDFRSEGAVGGYQGVLVTWVTQLDHDLSVSPGCTVSTELRHGADVLGTWAFEFYVTTNEKSSATASYLTMQATHTLATYEIWASSNCSQTTYTDQDLLTIQNFPFEGDGTGFEPTSIVKGEKLREKP